MIGEFGVVGGGFSHLPVEGGVAAGCVGREGGFGAEGERIVGVVAVGGGGA